MIHDAQTLFCPFITKTEQKLTRKVTAGLKSTEKEEEDEALLVCETKRTKRKETFIFR